MSNQVAPFDEIVRGELDEISDNLNQGSETLNGQGLSPEIIESASKSLSSAIREIGSLTSDARTPIRPLAEIVMDGLYGILDHVENVRRALDDMESECGEIGSVDGRLSDAAVLIEDLLGTAQAEHKRRNDL